MPLLDYESRMPPDRSRLTMAFAVLVLTPIGPLSLSALLIVITYWVGG